MTIEANETDTKQSDCLSDEELLEKIKSEFVRQLEDGEIKLKVGDLVKILDIQNKLSTDNDAREKFWELIEKARKKGLKHG